MPVIPRQREPRKTALEVIPLNRTRERSFVAAILTAVIVVSMPISLNAESSRASKTAESSRASKNAKTFLNDFEIKDTNPTSSLTKASQASPTSPNLLVSERSDSDQAETDILVVATLASGCACSGGAVVDLGKALGQRRIRLIVIEPKSSSASLSAAVSAAATSTKEGPLVGLVRKALDQTKARPEFAYLASSKEASFQKWNIAKTPEVLVFDQKGQLAYQGAIASDPKGDESPEPFLSHVLDDLEAQRSPRWTKREAFGCALPFGPLAR